MKILRWAITIACFVTSTHPEIRAEDTRNEWFSKRWQVVEEAKSLRNDKAIKQLGDIVRPLARDKNELSPEAADLYRVARDTLLAIPGHAEYYGKEIHKLMDETMQTRADSHLRGWAFATLEQLPSIETVKVLGELLYDDRDPWKDADFGDTGSPVLNFRRASMALTQLGIKKAPVKNVSTSAGFELSDVNTWQLWYEQVRDGSRTFSFEGDDKNYSLSGPVSVAKDGPTTSRPDRKATIAAGNGSEPIRSQDNRTPLVIAIILVVGIIVLTMRQVRKRSSRAT